MDRSFNTSSGIRLSQPRPLVANSPVNKSNSGEISYFSRSDRGMISYCIQIMSAGTMITSSKITAFSANIRGEAVIPEITDEELASAVISLRGAWADREDMTDEWLDDLRANVDRSWRERLVELYGNEDLSL